MNGKLKSLIAELEASIPFADTQQPGISQSTVGWHIEHALLVIDKTIDRLAQADSRNYRWKLSIPKLFVFITNSIPRGRGQSPASVLPAGDLTHEKLVSHIGHTTGKLSQLKQLSPGQFMEHPYFGHLKLKQAIKFLEIHTRHHLKIIKDIRA